VSDKYDGWVKKQSRACEESWFLQRYDALMRPDSIPSRHVTVRHIVTFMLFKASSLRTRSGGFSSLSEDVRANVSSHSASNSAALLSNTAFQRLASLINTIAREVTRGRSSTDVAVTSRTCYSTWAFAPVQDTEDPRPMLKHIEWHGSSGRLHDILINQRNSCTNTLQVCVVAESGIVSINATKLIVL
jgi:hypothetical protein